MTHPSTIDTSRPSRALPLPLLEDLPPAAAPAVRRPPHGEEAWQRQTVWRAAMYEALALAFSYPDADTLADLRGALEDLRDHTVSHERGITPGIIAALAALDAGPAEDLATAYTALFAGEVPLSACETDYEHDGFAKARQLADIAGFYRAFGLQVAAEQPGPVDFIATELEYMAGLAGRQAFAAAGGLHEQRLVCEDAERAFLQDHLGRWAPSFCRDLVAQDDPSRPVAFYPAAAALCDELVGADVLLFGARPLLPSSGRLTPEQEAFTCIYADECVAGAEDEP